MIAVIQCAATKQPDAGCLRSGAGKPVMFVANPDAAPRDDRHLYARPDDMSDRGLSWREVLLDYNRGGSNSLDLYPAWRLYQNSIYGMLVERLGIEKVFVLSAGWGLIRADFLTPAYDITFTQAAERYKRRQRSDTYHDFCMLCDDPQEAIIFFGSKSYVPLFPALTRAVRAERVVFYNSPPAPKAPGCTLVRFDTTTRTNWQYECAKAWLDGAIYLT